MRIVVTGGSGKIGHYVVNQLLAEPSHDVIVFDRYAPPQMPQTRWVRGEITDFGDVLSALRGCDAVIHLAAFPIPYQEVANHVLFQNNVTGTYNVYEAANFLGIKRVVTAGSGAVLGWAWGHRYAELTPQYLPLDEDHSLCPHDPYGLAKFCDEQVARSFAARCEMEAIVLRLSWVWFPDWTQQVRQQGGVVPKNLAHCAYIDVRDVATAFRSAVEVANLQHQILFITADDSTCLTPLSEVLPRLLPQLGNMSEGLTDQRPVISNERAKKRLGWRPRYSWRNAE